MGRPKNMCRLNENNLAFLKCTPNPKTGSKLTVKWKKEFLIIYWVEEIAGGGYSVVVSAWSFFSVKRKPTSMSTRCRDFFIAISLQIVARVLLAHRRSPGASTRVHTSREYRVGQFIELRLNRVKPQTTIWACLRTSNSHMGPFVVHHNYAISCDAGESPFRGNRFLKIHIFETKPLTNSIFWFLYFSS